MDYLYFKWSVCTEPDQGEVVYLCIRGIDFPSFYDFSNRFWNCSDVWYIFVLLFILFIYIFLFLWYFVIRAVTVTNCSNRHSNILSTTRHSNILSTNRHSNILSTNRHSSILSTTRQCCSNRHSNILSTTRQCSVLISLVWLHFDW